MAEIVWQCYCLHQVGKL